MTRALITLGVGFGLLVLQTSLATLVPIHAITPNLLLPMAIFLGVTHDVPLVRGAATSFTLGYLLDSFCGNTMGLHTFMLVATFIVARGAGLRLFLRGVSFQIGLTFFVGAAASGTLLALRAIFERTAIPASVWPESSSLPGSLDETLSLVVVPALATAITSPPVFALVRRIEGIQLQRTDARTSPP